MVLGVTYAAVTVHASRPMTADMRRLAPSLLTTLTLLACASPDAGTHTPRSATSGSTAPTAAPLELPATATPSAPSASAARIPAPKYATLAGPLVLEGPSKRPIFVVPGASITAEAPPAIITALHARCVDARENCEFLREIAAPNALLVCPTGNTPCGNGMSTWAGDARALAAEVEADTDFAEAATERPASARSNDALFGSSAGAFGARNIVNAGTTRWSSLILVGAKIELAPKQLEKDGIHRVLLVAPDWDEASATMKITRKTLCRAGVPSRFVSLGPHPHGMLDDSPRLIAAAMPWLLGRDAAVVACDEQ